MFRYHYPKAVDPPSVRLQFELVGHAVGMTVSKTITKISIKNVM